MKAYPPWTGLAMDPSKPTIKITSAEELAKAIPGKEWQDRIGKQVDFAKEYLLFFAWGGSSGDQLAFRFEDGKGVVFTYSQGVKDDLRPHYRMFAIRKDMNWRVEETRRDDHGVQTKSG